MTCHHPHRGTPWVMQPYAGGPVRRVRLCACGRTLPARVGATGAARFDGMAARAVRRQ